MRRRIEIDTPLRNAVTNAIKHLTTSCMGKPAIWSSSRGLLPERPAAHGIVGNRPLAVARNAPSRPSFFRSDSCRLSAGIDRRELNRIVSLFDLYQDELIYERGLVD
jgi:hypothetical protein